MIWYHVAAAVGVGTSFVLARLVAKCRHGEGFVWACSLFFLLARIAILVWKNLTEISVPVEISTVTYFLQPLVLLFRLRKAEHLACWFGILSGAGFFLFYLFCGFTVADSIPIGQHLISTASHGFLFFAGWYLMFRRDFRDRNPLAVWVTLLAMVAWALFAAQTVSSGITFIYYAIRPDFLNLFDSARANLLLKTGYLAVWVAAFSFAVFLLGKLNARLHSPQKEQTLETLFATDL